MHKTKTDRGVIAIAAIVIVTVIAGVANHRAVQVHQEVVRLRRVILQEVQVRVQALLDRDREAIKKVTIAAIEEGAIVAVDRVGVAIAANLEGTETGEDF